MAAGLRAGLGPAAQSKQRVRVGAEQWSAGAGQQPGDTVCRASVRSSGGDIRGHVTSYPEISFCLADMVRYD